MSRKINPDARTTIYRVAWARKDWETSGQAGTTFVRITEGYSTLEDVPTIVALACCPMGTTGEDVLILATEQVRPRRHAHEWRPDINAHVCRECSKAAGYDVHADYCEGQS
jgi:hypothetical protein